MSKKTVSVKGKSGGVKVVKSKVASTAARRSVVRKATSRVRTKTSAVKAIRR